MAKTYVDMDQLEKVFAEYMIPYNTVLENITPVSEFDIAERMSTRDLKITLDKKPDVFALQIWTDEDIKASLRGHGIDPETVGKATMDAIAIASRAPIEDPTDNWEKLHAAVVACTKGGKGK